MLLKQWELRALDVAQASRALLEKMEALDLDQEVELEILALKMALEQLDLGGLTHVEDVRA